MKPISSKGVLMAVATGFVSGISVYLNKFGVGLWADSSSYTTAKNIIAALFLTSLILILKKAPELKSLSKKQWRNLLIIGSVGGSIPFLLFFKSLSLVSATEAAFIHKTLFLWVAILAYPFLKEKLSWIQVSALGILFFAVYLLGAPSQWTFGVGSLMALVATLLWAIETVVAKRVLKEISATTTAWARMFFGSLILLAWLFVTGGASGIIPQTFGQAFWAIAVGTILFVYVFAWYSALELAPATVVSSILVIAAPITAIINGVVIAGSFKTDAIAPLLIMFVGIILISNKFELIYSKLFKKSNRAISS